MKQALCHPVRPVAAKGLCWACYAQKRRAEGKSGSPNKAKCHPNRSHAANGLCGACYMKHLRLTVPQKIKHGKKSSRLFKKYNITYDDFVDMIAQQDARCAICNKLPMTLFHVDHNHKTGKVRELLCQQCNVGLGCFHEDIDVLDSAAAYVIKHLDKS